METLLPRSVLTGLLLHLTLYVVLSSITRKRRSTITDPTIQPESSSEKSVYRCGPPTRIFIPNVLARWPWPRRINPNYAMVRREADAWMSSFQAFGPKAQDAFKRCDFSTSFPLCRTHVLTLLDSSARLFSLPKSEQR